MPPRVTNLALHVLRRVDRTGRCWLWRGATNGQGYGEIRADYRKAYVHRLVFEWTYGAIPAGLVVRHTCDTPACCNPAHLLIGTPRENSQDMVSRGRANPWQRNATTCRRGHPFDETNTRHHADGSRSCRECANARRRKAGGRGPYQPRERAA